VSRRRILTLMAAAFACGVAAAIVKGQSGDGLGVLSRVRSDIGNLSAPWVLLAWAAGSRTTRLPLAAALGLGATAAALVGFYVVSALVEPMGGSTVAQDVGSWVAANRVYFEAGAVSGPVFGLLGGWWARRRSPSPLLIAGLLLLGEPLVLWITGAIFPNGVLSPLTGLPLAVRIFPGFGLSDADAVSLGVHCAEIGAGVVFVLVAVRRRGARRLGPVGS
jgi:hypothetical protein